MAIPANQRLWVPLLCLAALAACRDERSPTTPKPPPPVEALRPVGVVEVTITGIGGGQARASASVPEGIRFALSRPANGDASGNGTIQLEPVATGSFTEGTRGVDGVRYLYATFRVRNAEQDGAPYTTPRQNLTFLGVQSAGTKAGTPVVALKRFDGSDADSLVAAAVTPTGAVELDDSLRVAPRTADVLQVLAESEVAALTLPAGVTGALPYGFVVRNPNVAASRTLPASPGPNQFDGIVTFAFRLPLQAAAADDPFTITMLFLAVDDGQTRVTESIEDQTVAGRAAVDARADELGATMVTVLDGSPSLGYPGQRQICAARTAGPAGAPTGAINRPGAYSRLAQYYPGETVDACAANFRAGAAGRPAITVPFPVTVRAMDRYGNVIPAADIVTLSTSDGTATGLSPATALAAGVGVFDVTYNTYGTFTNVAAGLRRAGLHPVQVSGSTRTWTGAVSTDWHVGANWSPAGGPPAALDTAVVPGERPNYPLLTQNTTIGGVTMTPGSGVEPTVNVGAFDFTLTSSIDHGPTGLVLGTGRMIFTGFGQTISGGLSNVDYRNARFTGTYSLNTNLNVTGGRIVVQGGRLRSTSFRIRVRPS